MSFARRLQTISMRNLSVSLSLSTFAHLQYGKQHAAAAVTRHKSRKTSVCTKTNLLSTCSLSDPIFHQCSGDKSTPYSRHQIEQDKETSKLLDEIQCLTLECEALQKAQDQSAIMAALMTAEVKRLEKLLDVERQRYKERSTRKHTP